MKKSFAHKVIALTEKVEVLLAKGWTKKTIAKELKMFPSVLSVINNKITQDLKQMVQRNTLSPSMITEVFNPINNVSERKLRQNIDDYLEILKGLAEVTEKSALTNYMEGFYEHTPYDKLSMYCGTYYCYYISSFNYKVKREPFFITKDPRTGQIWAKKGNALSPSTLKGIVYTTNNQLLTMQLREEDTVVSDQFMAHFNLPPSYDGHIHLLKGLAVSFSNSYLPIARKIVLKKVADCVLPEHQEAIRTIFYEDATSDPIAMYLLKNTSLLEYYHTPRPQFNESDLDKELLLMGLQD